MFKGQHLYWKTWGLGKGSRWVLQNGNRTEKSDVEFEALGLILYNCSQRFLENLKLFSTAVCDLGKIFLLQGCVKA